MTLDASLNADEVVNKFIYTQQTTGQGPGKSWWN